MNKQDIIKIGFYFFWFFMRFLVSQMMTHDQKSMPVQSRSSI